MTAAHRNPSGTRDVLPDEMRELRAITERIRAEFERFGYGELSTPALEYDTPAARAAGEGGQPPYRMFDERGNVLVLRTDMTVPIARVATTRYAGAEPPLRFCYFAHAYRGVRPARGQSREQLQAGIELLGAPAPQGTAEALGVLCAVLEASGLRAFRVGVGDVSLYPALLDALRVPADAQARMLAELGSRDFVGLEREVAALDLPAADAALLCSVPQARGGPEVLTGLTGPPAEAAAGMRALHDLLPAAVAERVIFDLGLVRSLGYYTGAVFEIYDPAVGVPIGRGGRYDDLLARFGRPLPGVGFALGVEQLHVALAGEERGEGVRR